MTNLAVLACLIALYCFGIFPQEIALVLTCILAYYSILRLGLIWKILKGSVGVSKTTTDNLSISWIMHLATLISAFATIQAGFIIVPVVFLITVPPTLFFLGLSTLLTFGILEIGEDA